MVHEEVENLINKLVEDKINNKNLISKNDLEEKTDHNHEKHSHAVRSFDQFCPECSEKNPDYKESDFFCADCLTPIGSLSDLENSKVCYNCGSLDGIDKKSLEAKKEGD